jgi:ATP-binding cassette subfamily F protein 3
VLKLVDIEYRIGERTLFSQVDFNVNKFDRFGLVGANGTGKTTLLRLISGEISGTKGHVDMPKNLRIGYLPQEEIVLHGNKLIDEVLQDFHKHLKRLSKIGKSLEKNPHSKERLKEYTRAEDE